MENKKDTAKSVEVQLSVLMGNKKNTVKSVEGLSTVLMET